MNRASEMRGNKASVIQRIHDIYAELPAGERKAADLVLDSPGDLAVWSASELAERSGVSPPTISRLIRRLGYDSHDEARRAARSMRATGSPLYLSEGDNARTDTGLLLSESLMLETNLIEASLATINPLVLDSLAEGLARARRIRMAGFRNSHALAEIARLMLAQMRRDVAMLNPAGQTLAEGIAMVGEGDLVLIFGFRRRPAGFSNFVRAVGQRGADVALISDKSVREAPAHARWSLTCAVETPQSLDSYVGVLAVLRLLALRTMRKLGADGRRHLGAIEELHDFLNELE